MTVFVHVQPCEQHHKGARCFHSYGGLYVVLRPLSKGAVVLEHVASGNRGLADMDEIVPVEEA